MNIAEAAKRVKLITAFALCFLFAEMAPVRSVSPLFSQGGKGTASSVASGSATSSNIGYSKEYSKNDRELYSYVYGQTYYADRAPILGLSVPGAGTPYEARLVSTVTEQAQKYSIGVQVMTAGNDPAVQDAQISGLILQKVNAIILVPTDSARLSDAVLRIKKYNIPLIDLDIEMDDDVIDMIDTFIGSNPYEQGEMAAELLTDALKKRGGTYAVLIPAPPCKEVLERVGELRQKMSSEGGVREEPLIAAPAGRVQAAVTAYLQAHPCPDVLYVDDGCSLSGCEAALRAAGLARFVKIVTVVRDPAVVRQTAQGGVYGAIVNSPSWEGARAVDSVRDILNGTKPKVWYRASLYSITNQNAEILQKVW